MSRSSQGNHALKGRVARYICSLTPLTGCAALCFAHSLRSQAGSFTLLTHHAKPVDITAPIHQHYCSCPTTTLTQPICMQLIFFWNGAKKQHASNVRGEFHLNFIQLRKLVTGKFFNQSRWNSWWIESFFCVLQNGAKRDLLFVFV